MNKKKLYIEYVLDQGLDDPNEFDDACFILGDNESSTLSPQK